MPYIKKEDFHKQREMEARFALLENQLANLKSENEKLKKKKGKAGRPPKKELCDAGLRACDKPEAQGKILVISDLHAPYHHKDALPFLKALQAKYFFTNIINIGDELDYHALSYHENDPDLYSAGYELHEGRKVLWELERVFPEMTLIDSNHGSLAYRKAKTGGMPHHLVVPYRDAIFAEKDAYGNLDRQGRGDGWRWTDRLVLRVPNQPHPVTFIHGVQTDVRNAVRRIHTNVVQGHYHTQGDIRYEATYNGVLWGMTVGCLLDDTSRAFSYNKMIPQRPVLSCGGIIDGVPRIFPMLLDEAGRWTGLVP